MSFLMSGKVLMESQFVVPVVLNVVFALFLISACVESFLQPQLLVRFNFLTFLLFNGMIMLDCLIYLFVEPKLRTLILLRVKRWRLERSFNHNVRKRQLPSPTTTEALAMSVLNFWQISCTIYETSKRFFKFWFNLSQSPDLNWLSFEPPR